MQRYHGIIAFEPTPRTRIVIGRGRWEWGYERDGDVRRWWGTLFRLCACIAHSPTGFRPLSDDPVDHHHAAAALDGHDEAFFDEWNRGEDPALIEWSRA